jgi:hypothetical protein
LEPAESVGGASQLPPYGVEYRDPGEHPTVPIAAAKESVALSSFAEPDFPIM